VSAGFVVPAQDEYLELERRRALHQYHDRRRRRFRRFFPARGKPTSSISALGFEYIQIELFANSPLALPPVRESAFGRKHRRSTSPPAGLRWDSVIWPTSGPGRRCSGELGSPRRRITYYKTSFQQQYYYPFTERWVGFVNGELGVAWRLRRQVSPSSRTSLSVAWPRCAYRTERSAQGHHRRRGGCRQEDRVQRNCCFHCRAWARTSPSA
jgi:hypothetical protein